LIAVIDYGMGNLRSVQKALEKTGMDARITCSPRQVDDAAAVVLPGVGAFRDCVMSLDRLKLTAPVKRAISSGKPFLGICLGLQVLFTASEEFGTWEGLDVIPGRVVRFPSDMQDPEGGPADRLKIPHMGWNQADVEKQTPVLEGIPSGSYFYFVHSYYVEPEDKSAAATTTGYGIRFVSSVARDNLFACQFHPEKSQHPGLQLLANFAKTVDGG